MSSLQERNLWSELTTGEFEADGKRAYFQSRIRNRLYDYIIEKFEERQRSDNLTKAELARRMGTSPAVVNRYFASPGNWTLDTISNLLLGIAAEELKPASETVVNIFPQNLDGESLFRLLREDQNKSNNAEQHPTKPPRPEKSAQDEYTR